MDKTCDTCQRLCKIRRSLRVWFTGPRFRDLLYPELATRIASACRYYEPPTQASVAHGRQTECRCEHKTNT